MSGERIEGELRDLPTRGSTDILREHPFASGLDEATVALVAGCARNAVFHAGDFLLREGAHADEFHLLRHGSVALEMNVPGRGVLTFLTLGEGDMLGVNWLIPPYRWAYDARAVTLVRTIAFDATCLRGKCDADPQVGYALTTRFLKLMVERLHLARMQCAHLYDEQRFAEDAKPAFYKGGENTDTNPV